MRPVHPVRRWIAALLIAAQVLAPATAWSQSQRSTSPAPPAVDSKGPPPAPPARPAVDRRLALIIGNTTYKSVPLVNPTNDARLMAKTLQGLGFEVILRENLGLRDFKAVMRQFVTRMENEDGTALLYYAGHGVQIEGRNYLLPVDVGTGDEYEVRDESVDLDETLMSRLAKARKRERIIVLDACRDDPFKARKQQSRGIGRRGLAQMGSDEKGVLIVYSTSPGHTAEDGAGKNSLFTQHFAAEIDREGVEVSQALRTVFSAVHKATAGRQTPWSNSSLLTDFYFRPVNPKVEEERRRREFQNELDAALKAAKQEEAARIEAAIAVHERARQDRERQYMSQIAEMKSLLERRDRDLEAARTQVAMAAKNRDEQLLALRDAENERRRVERDREALAAAAASQAKDTAAAQQAKEASAAQQAKDAAAAQQQARDTAAADAARKAEGEALRKAEAERLAKEKREREAVAAAVAAERNKLLKLEAAYRAADEKAAREEAERQARVAAELAKREAAAKAAAEKAERDARALAEAQRKAEERDRLAQAEAARKAAVLAKREEAARLAKENAERLAALDEQARQNAAKERAAQEALAKRKSDEGARTTVMVASARDSIAKDAARTSASRDSAARDGAAREAAARDAAGRDAAARDSAARDAVIRAADEKLKKAKEDAERAAREAEAAQRLAQIEEDVRQKAQRELDLLSRKATLPPELAALMITEVGKVVVSGSSDFFVRGIRLPADVAVRTPDSNVPPACAAFAGAWGQGRWNGERSAEIWVESVDADCRARAIYARGGLGMSGEQATYLRGDGRVSGNTLSLDFPGNVRIELSRSGDRADGRWSSGVNTATAQFVRIPAVPDRPTTLFANESMDYGAKQSRVISASQINTNERSRIETMLPLPTAVPGVDTLTTLQLDALMKKNPETVLVDAFVGAPHRTLPGAYWMPELGVVTIGQKERDQIDATLRAANGGDPSRPIVVFERSSTYGWFGYHAVLRLLGMGYTNIYWYRGGLDAWHDAQLQLAQAEAWKRAR